jgi:hemolysin activation/secretion protein
MVLAARLGGGNSFGDIPFSGYQSYGGRNQRGYPQGKYRGKHTTAVQAELRWMFSERWGVVAFAGSGKVWGSEDVETFRSAEWLPSIGAGIRFRLLKKLKINARLDVAYGKNGNDGIYFSLMEAF